MKKKGFTLIELLAVIVILAVIALIATPLIMNVINDAKKNAFKDSAYGIIKAVELRVSSEYVQGNSGRYKVDVTTEAISYAGDRPTSGWATVDEDGNVTLYMCNSSYCATNTDASDNETRTEEIRITSDSSEMSDIHEKIDALAQSNNDEYTILTPDGSEGGGSDVPDTPDEPIENEVVYVVDTTELSIGGAIPTGVNIRNTPEDAMADWVSILGANEDLKPYYIKYELNNDKIVTSDVEFVITEAVANSNSGMTAGTYTLKFAPGTGCTYDEFGQLESCEQSSPYFEENIATMKRAFGNSRCSNGNNSVQYGCDISGLSVYTSSNGYIHATDAYTRATYCFVDKDGISSCYKE